MLLPSALLSLAYLLAALWIALNIGAWLHLLWLCRRPSTPTPDAGPLPSPEALPTITVQLPLYNEEHAVVGLLDAVAALDWPADRLEIQILDDSTDHTPAVITAHLPRLQQTRPGLCIHHLRRSHRAGFKAGALAHGLAHARGTLVAIFDADFRPAPDFLQRAAAVLLAEPALGLVQARWSFTNASASLLTRAQALHLDVHFALEQRARSGGGLLMGFNGTAGLWRRACIDGGGGWEGDTLTEDLDLAYRAQLAGWRLCYLDGLHVPSELPEDIAAVRSQQHRWIRGGAQVARKLLRALWRAPRLSLRQRLQGTAHLLASSVFLPVLGLCLLTPLLPVALPHATAHPASAAALGIASTLLWGVLGVMLLAFGAACTHRAGALPRGLGRLLRDFPPYLALATAIAAHNARAAWLGWRGPTGTFVRTPKQGHPRLRGSATPAEVAVALWSWLGVALALGLHQPALVPFLLLQALAFSAWVWWSAAP